MENYTTDDSNIETIDISAVHKKARKIDMSLFLKLSDECEIISKIYKITEQTLTRAIDQMTETIGLGSVDFKLGSSPKLVNLLMCSRGNIPPLPITGSDGDYSYTIIAKVNNNGPMPEVSAAIYRTASSGPMNGFWVFDFKLMDWSIVNYANHLGYTQKQFDIIQNKPNSNEALLLKVSSTGKKIMPDFAFEELCEKNEEILNLYKKTDLFVSLNFDQEGQEAFLAPLKSDAADGLSVTFHNGFYELNAVAHTSSNNPIQADEMDGSFENGTLTCAIENNDKPFILDMVSLNDKTVICTLRTDDYEMQLNMKKSTEKELKKAKKMAAASEQKSKKNADSGSEPDTDNYIDSDGTSTAKTKDIKPGTAGAAAHTN